MRRREFIVGIGLSGGWPLVSRAQQGERVRRIGVLSNKSSGDVQGREEAAAFAEALRRRNGLNGSKFTNAGEFAGVANDRRTRAVPLPP
jgi:hypothetical protein